MMYDKQHEHKIPLRENGAEQWSKERLFPSSFHKSVPQRNESVPRRDAYASAANDVIKDKKLRKVFTYEKDSNN